VPEPATENKRRMPWTFGNGVKKTKKLVQKDRQNKGSRPQIEKSIVGFRGEGGGGKCQKVGGQKGGDNALGLEKLQESGRLLSWKTGGTKHQGCWLTIWGKGSGGIPHFLGPTGCGEKNIEWKKDKGKTENLGGEGAIGNVRTRVWKTTFSKKKRTMQQKEGGTSSKKASGEENHEKK